jgi:hypothetical protein
LPETSPESAFAPETGSAVGEATAGAPDTDAAAPETGAVAPGNDPAAEEKPDDAPAGGPETEGTPAGGPETEGTPAGGAETEDGPAAGAETDDAAAGPETDKTDPGAETNDGAGAETDDDAAPPAGADPVADDHGTGMAGPSAGPNGEDAPGEVGALAGAEDRYVAPTAGCVPADAGTDAAMVPAPPGLARIDPGIAAGSFGAGASGVV